MSTDKTNIHNALIKIEKNVDARLAHIEGELKSMMERYESKLRREIGDRVVPVDAVHGLVTSVGNDIVNKMQSNWNGILPTQMRALRDLMDNLRKDFAGDMLDEFTSALRSVIESEASMAAGNEVTKRAETAVLKEMNRHLKNQASVMNANISDSFEALVRDIKITLAKLPSEKQEGDAK